jgi:hypothetical protein
VKMGWTRRDLRTNLNVAQGNTLVCLRLLGKGVIQRDEIFTRVSEADDD